MNFFKELLIIESQKTANKEIEYTISIINKIYNEWKKTGRRKNAVDLVTTSMNKLSNINPSTVDFIHEASRLKLATLIMRCMEMPIWKPIETKEKLYKKLYPLINKLQSYNPQASTGGVLRDIIATRISAALCYQNKDPFIFVSYEPLVPTSYLSYLFGPNQPEKVYKMQTLSLPEDFDTLVEILTINLEKCKKKFALNIDK